MVDNTTIRLATDYVLTRELYQYLVRGWAKVTITAQPAKTQERKKPPAREGFQAFFVIVASFSVVCNCMYGGKTHPSF